MLEQVPEGVALAALLIALLAIAGVGKQYGWGLAMSAAVIAGAMFLPSPIFWTGPHASYVGISSRSPALYTSTAVLIAATMLPLRRAPPSIGLMSLLSTGYLGLGFVVFWPTEALVLSGVTHFLVALLAFHLGIRLALSGLLLTGTYEKFLAIIVLALLGQLLLCIVQLFGYPLSIYPDISNFLAEGRVVGSFNHPSTLGKFCLVLVPVVAPTFFSRGLSFRLGWSIAVLTVVLSGLTRARANTLAICVALGIVALVGLMKQNRGLSGRRVLTIAACGAAAAGALSVTFQRLGFKDSGDRQHFMEVALNALGSVWRTGLGANRYLEVIGPTDALSAAGFPVHNFVVLLAVELGVVGMALVAYPAWITLGTSVRACFSLSSRSTWAIGYMASVPGLLIIGLTGWGMLAGTTLHFWYFCTGLSYGMLRLQRSSAADVASRDLFTIYGPDPRVDVRHSENLVDRRRR